MRKKIKKQMAEFLPMIFISMFQLPQVDYSVPMTKGILGRISGMVSDDLL